MYADFGIIGGQRLISGWCLGAEWKSAQIEMAGNQSSHG